MTIGERDSRIHIVTGAAADLANHHQRGSIYENYVIAEHIKELRQVDVHCPAIPFADIAMYLLDRSMGVASRTEPEAGLGELRIPHRAEDLEHRLLDHPAYRPTEEHQVRIAWWGRRRSILNGIELRYEATNLLVAPDLGVGRYGVGGSESGVVGVGISLTRRPT